MEEQKKKVAEDRPAYMREYMKKKYHENPTEWRKKKNIFRIRRTHQPTPQEVEMFKDYLMSYCLIKKYKEDIPQEVWNQMVMSLSYTPCLTLNVGERDEDSLSLGVLADNSVGVSDSSTDSDFSSL